MQGIYNDNDDPGASPRQPPQVLAAWIAELLGDLRHMQVRRLSQLRSRLQADTFASDHSSLAQAVLAVHSAGRGLHVRELRQGWIDKLLGRHRAVYARFVTAYDRVVACAARLKTEAAELAGSSKTNNAAARLALVELDMELKAVHVELERGVGWLQDMCVQLSQAGDAAADPELAECADAARVFTEQFKRLQAITTIGRDIGVRGNDVFARRAALLEQVRADMEVLEKSWIRALTKPVADAKAGRHPALGAGKVAEAHDDLMKRLSLAGDACSALQHEEHLVAQQLLQLRQELDALA